MIEKPYKEMMKNTIQNTYKYNMFKASKINEVLKRKKITQKELAEKIGMNERTVGQFLKSNSIKVHVLEKVSKVLDVPLSYWFSEEETAVDMGRSLNQMKMEGQLRKTIAEKEVKNIPDGYVSGSIVNKLMDQTEKDKKVLWDHIVFLQGLIKKPGE